MKEAKDVELARLEKEIVEKRLEQTRQVEVIIDLTTKAREKTQEEARIVSTPTPTPSLPPDFPARCS